MIVENDAPNDYINLFNAVAQKKIVLQSTISLKYRNNVTHYIYDKKYSLEVTKIGIKSNLRLRRDIVENYKSEDGNFPNVSLPINETDFTTNYNGTSTDTASKIYLSLHGDSIHTMLKNDSIAYYFLKLKSVYISYAPKGTYDIYIQANTKFYFFTKNKPVSLMFIKKNNTVYFLLLTVKDTDEELYPNLLYKLINK
jgi:hypothetical protein